MMVIVKVTALWPPWFKDPWICG